MERMAWKGRIKHGCKEEYIRRHREFWSEMVAVLDEKLKYIYDSNYNGWRTESFTSLASVKDEIHIPTYFNDEKILGYHFYYSPSTSVSGAGITMNFLKNTVKFSVDSDNTMFETDDNGNNINAVARYLEDLKPMAPQSTLISEASFNRTDVSRVLEADGTYTVTVTANVTASVEGNTALTLTAVAD